MPSRMEKYYQTDTEVVRRTKKNRSLYDEIHNNLNYENVRPATNVNEITSERLNEILKSEKKQEYRTNQNRVYETEASNYITNDEDKNYDIKEALQKAKSDNGTKKDYHKLNVDQINLLKKIESYKASKQEQDENLNELLNTIASTKLLSNLNDRDLSLDLLGDLKSNNDDTIVGGIDSINKVMHEIPKVSMPENEKNEIDKSFYTSSLSFSDEDFDDIKEIKNKIKKNNALIKALTIGFVFVVIVVIILVFVII